MGQSTSVMNKLAWRAKWRKRWEKYRNAFLLIFLVVFGSLAVIVFTPWGPKMLYAEIAANKQNPINELITTDAAKNMYRLGWFYSITMRKKEGVQCFKTIEKWYYGVDLEEDFYKRYDDEEKALDFEPDAMYWLRAAVFDHAEYWQLHSKKALAHFLYGKYLDLVDQMSEEEREDIPVEEESRIQRAKRLRELYNI